MKTFVLALALLPMLASAVPLPGTPEEYFDILGTGQKEWRMAFRGTAGIKKSMYDAYKDGRGIPSYVEEGCKSTNWRKPCQNHYRNKDVFDTWAKDAVKEVLYGIIDDGKLVKTMRFNASQSTNMNWMAHDRLISSCWEDLKASKPLYFSIDGDAPNSRRFFIHNNYGGCDNDAGWTVVSDKEDRPCSWERGQAYPHIKYVAGVKYENMNLPKIKSAQAVVVFVKYDKQRQGHEAQYYDLFRSGQKEWRFAFRGTAKVGYPVYDAYMNGAGIPSRVEPGCTTVDWNAQCYNHWRNTAAFDDWKDEVKQVLFAIIYKGEIVKTLIFDAKDSTYEDWFKHDRLIKSCWEDLSMAPYNYFSIKGDEPRNRRFFIQRNYGGCSTDQGWFVVSDAPPTPCPWEVTDRYPMFKFAAGPKHGLWSTTEEVLEADAFAIFLKY